MEKIFKPARIVVVLSVFIAVCTVYVLALYDMQIINGDTSLEEARNTIQATTTVVASRGEITDRYGRVLVSNRSCYNVVIDTTALLKHEDPNSVLLSLILYAEKTGYKHNDSMPISFYPYTYLEDQTSIQESRLSKFLQNFKQLDESTGAEALMDFMKERYGISKDMDERAARLVIGVRYELESRRFSNAPAYVFFEDVDIELISIIKEQDYQGIELEPASVREYHTQYASHILGAVGPITDYEEYRAKGYSMNAIVGRDGVEAAFEDYLRGYNGKVTTTTNEYGAVTGVLTTEEAIPGGNVTLTLDIMLQKAVEESLSNTIDSINAARKTGEAKSEHGAAVVLDPTTFEVLSLASYPSYSAESQYNYALKGTYTPGSTFKMVTALAALKSGKITKSTSIYDKGAFTISNLSFKCWIHPGSHGSVNMVQAIAQSCNYYFYSVGEKIGISSIADMATQFGLGEETGIELNGEAKGIVSSQAYKEMKIGETWYPGDTVQTAIGQSYNSFTPIQLASYTATLANGGRRYKTHLLKNVKSYDYTEVLHEEKPVLLNTVDADAAHMSTVREGMLAVTQSGTARSAFGNYDVKVAAKTGTAQLGENVKNNGVFICFAPYDNPEIAVAVVLENAGSSSYALSAAKQILDYYFDAKTRGDAISTENTLLR